MATKQVIAQRRALAHDQIVSAAGYLELEKKFPPLVLPTYNPDKAYEQMLQFEALAAYLQAVIGRCVTGVIEMPEVDGNLEPSGSGADNPNGTDNGVDTQPIPVPPTTSDTASNSIDPNETGKTTLDPKKENLPPENAAVGGS